MWEFIHLFIVAAMSNNNVALNLLVVALQHCMLQLHISHFCSNATYHAKSLCNCACNKSRFFRIYINCFNLHNSSILHWNHLKVIGIQWISLSLKSPPAAAADSAGLAATLISLDLEKNSPPHHNAPYLNRGVQRRMASGVDRTF